MVMISSFKLKFALMSIIMVLNEQSNILEINKSIFAITRKLIWMKLMSFPLTELKMEI